jgi:hypothetical protein
LSTWNISLHLRF